MRQMLVVAGVAIVAAVLAGSSWSDTSSQQASQATEWPIPASEEGAGGGPPPELLERGFFAQPIGPDDQRRAYEDLSPAEQEAFERVVAHREERAEAVRILEEAAKERAVIAASEAAQIMLGAQDLGQIGVVP